jgi:hypothetical protein
MEKHGELLFHKTHKLWFKGRGNIKEMTIKTIKQGFFEFLSHFSMSFIVWRGIFFLFYPFNRSSFDTKCNFISVQILFLYNAIAFNIISSGVNRKIFSFEDELFLWTNNKVDIFVQNHL